jgi:XRE family transcriptional regulator, aerobic/anaerobic benzoate catabolism transcriptional regulator
MTETLYLSRLGDRVRAWRTEHGMTRKTLSQASGVSERYLAQLEAGEGNISVLLLRKVANAMGVPVAELVRDDEHRPEKPVALLGLRGAGKSTLGKMLAKKIGWKFVELNKEVEAQNGLSVAEIIALYGQEGFRRMEQAALTQLLARKELMVLATGGGIVSEPLTFDLILSSFYTIWLKAEPEEHMARVRGQGDLRPMADDRSAMAELRNILISREPLYARASAVVDTAGLSVDAAAARLNDAVAPVLHDKHAFGLRSAVS